MKHLLGRGGQSLKHSFGEGQKAKLERRAARRLSRGERSGEKRMRSLGAGGTSRRLRLGTKWDFIRQWSRASVDPVWPVQPALAGQEQ